MKINKVSILYFSPTNNTKKVCEAIAKPFSEVDIYEYDRTAFENRWTGAEFGQNELVIIGVPVYYGRVPQMMNEFFRSIKVNKTPVVFVVTYGNRDYEDALVELQDICTEKGFVGVAGGAFIGEHSFSKKMGTARPDANDLAEIEQFGEQIKNRLEEIESLEDISLKVKGKHPYCTGFDRPIKPQTNDKCDGCMLCQKQCPMKAISPYDPKDIDGWRCIFCGKCIHECKKGAKNIGLAPLKEKIAIMEAMFITPKKNETFII